MEIGGWSYAGAFAVSLALALGLTPIALRLAVSKEVLDRPGDYKVQESPVPYLGGVAIVISFAIAVAIATLINPPASRVGELMVLLGGGVGLSLMGLIDDLRGLPPLLRLVVQIGAALAVWSTGVGVQLFDASAANAVLTVFWIVGVTNAFNLLDNMDGLSAGTAAIASGFIFVLAAMNGQLLVAALSIALCGCALGFLRHNVHPAKIYMGDAGSLFLGFMLAVLGVKLRFDAPASVTFMVPILVLGVAIFDTTLVVTSRLLNKRGVLTGGRDHISHRLVFVGIPVRAAVALVYGAGTSLGWLAIVMSRQDRTTGFILMGLVVALALFAGTLLGSVPVYETSKRRKLMITEVSPHEEPGDADEEEDASVTA
jgi:UDP-GlcNAc:undecaprenyl-phosphate/decaprenyl-phosphate GlcNAc-1-phosphate transferase